MARLGIAPHVADKILNHQSGTISGVAAVYQRHEFLPEVQHNQSNNGHSAVSNERPFWAPRQSLSLRFPQSAA